MAESTFHSNLLMVVLDACGDYRSSLLSEEPAQRLAFSQCLDHVISFLNAYLLISQNHSVSVCLSHQAGSELVYPVMGVSALEPSHEELRSGKYEPVAHMNGILRNEVARVLTSQHPPQVASSTLLSGGLSKSLCYVQRCMREAGAGQTVKPRILVVRASKDMPSQHIPVMNCLFAAQKHSGTAGDQFTVVLVVEVKSYWQMLDYSILENLIDIFLLKDDNTNYNIPIDSCVLWKDSSYLQQASDITGGLYLLVPEPAGLLQFLLWTFLPDQSTASLLSLPSQLLVDHRAACFCHHKLVEMGFVCSVCLAIFCQFSPICTTCHTHFHLPNLPPPKMKKKKSKQR